MEKKFEEATAKLFATIDSVDMDTIKTSGVTLRAGDKVFKLQITEEIPLDVINEAKNDLRATLNQKLKAIKDEFTKTVSELTTFTHTVRADFEKKEAELRDRLAKSHIMPPVYERHARMGISVIGGERKDEVIWLVAAMYEPKFIDRKPIDPKMVRKLRTPIYIAITTEGEQVKGVKTRTINGFQPFQHYHQMSSNSDCWGNWQYPRTWKTVEDIANIAGAAMGVLENVNTASIATTNPRGLPTIQALKKFIDDGASIRLDSVDAVSGRRRRRSPEMDDIEIRTGEVAGIDVWDASRS